jgi:hypothetical protein
LRHIPYHASAFDWGNSSDGAADLALSILANYLGERPRLDSKRFLYGEYLSWQLHQRYKNDVIAKLPQTERWSITGEQVANWLKRQPEYALWLLPRDLL